MLVHRGWAKLMNAHGPARQQNGSGPAWVCTAEVQEACFSAGRARGAATSEIHSTHQPSALHAAHQCDQDGEELPSAKRTKLNGKPPCSSAVLDGHDQHLQGMPSLRLSDGMQYLTKAVSSSAPKAAEQLVRR